MIARSPAPPATTPHSGTGPTAGRVHHDPLFAAARAFSAASSTARAAATTSSDVLAEAAIADALRASDSASCAVYVATPAGA